MRFDSIKSLAVVGIVSVGFLVNGCLTDDKKEPAKDTTTTPVASELSMDTVLLGAQTNALAGSLDVDLWDSYKATEGVTEYTSIDVVFAYSTASSQAALYSPNIAKYGSAGVAGGTTSGFDFMKDWPGANTTQLKIPAAGFDISKVTKGAELTSAFAAAADPTVVGKVPVSSGTVVLIKSNLNMIVALKVLSVTTGADGTLLLQGLAMW